MRVRNLVELFDWLEALIDSVTRSPYCKPNRFQSFCPISNGNMAKSYIGGSEYFCDLADDLEKAQHEIYITDWWMSPEVYLKRPVPVKPDGSLDIQFRLDNILKRAAERGCKVFILLYREFEHALPNKSGYTQSHMMDLIKDKSNNNIEVIRHPGNLIFLWSHHEKIVVIDQKVAYLGGLDICYGRWDLPYYPLYDPSPDLTKEIYFPGQDYSNVRIKDFVDVDKVFEPLVDRQTVPRMPWRDIAVQLRGPVTKDVTRHFIQYWNFAKSDLEGSNRKNFLMKKDFEKDKDPSVSRSKKSKAKYQIVSFKKKDNKVKPMKDPQDPEVNEALLKEKGGHSKEDTYDMEEGEIRYGLK